MNAVEVLLDANVIYPAPLRDVFVQMASMGIIRARWTNEIHDEWISALLQKEPPTTTCIFRTHARPQEKKFNKFFLLIFGKSLDINA